MILSDEHRLAFVHIPKCAGVSVKQPLRAIDSTDGYFSRIGDHAELGRIHYAHIVLADLAAHFPEAWAKVQAYEAFAVVRDPQKRFLSALFQRMREFKGYDQSAITPARMEEEATGVIAHLERAAGRLDLNHVHFNRQTDFIFHDRRQVVGNLFAIEDMPGIIAFVQRTTGIAMAEERKNRSTEIRFSPLRNMVRLLRAPYGTLVPYPVRNRIRARLARTGLYVDAGRQPHMRLSERTESFVNSYYAADRELHAACR